MNHRVARIVFGLGVGLLAAFLAYRWASDPAPRAERELQENVVLETRRLLSATLDIGELQVVDALAPDRKVGKAYVYRFGDGWEVSGFYRRDESDPWHPYLATLDASLALTHLKVSDPALLEIPPDGTVLEVMP